MTTPIGPHDDDELVLRALLALVETEEAIAEHGHDPLVDADAVAAVAGRLRARAGSSGQVRSPLDMPSDTSRPDDVDVEWLILSTASGLAVRSASTAELEAFEARDERTGARLSVRRETGGPWTLRVSAASPGRYTVDIGWAGQPGEVITIGLEVKGRRSEPVPLEGPDSAPVRVRIRPA